MLTLLIALGQAAMPTPLFAQPLAVPPGFRGTVTVHGRGLDRLLPFMAVRDGVVVRVVKPGKKGSPPQGLSREQAGDSTVELALVVPRSHGGGTVALPLPPAGRLSLAIDPQNVVPEVEPNGGLTQAQLVARAVTFAGVFQQDRDVDVVRFALKKGELLEVRGTTHGGPADLILTLWDDAGHLLATADERTGHKLSYQAPQDGEYRLSLTDASDRGGALFGYRVVVR